MQRHGKIRDWHSSYAGDKVWRDFSYTSTNGIQIIEIAADQNIPKPRQYGQAFIISKKWANYFWGAKKISERISAAQF
jgi:hypothetical protein